MADAHIDPNRDRGSPSEWIDRQCDAFESQMQAGVHPALEAYLADCPPALRGRLFRELLVLELDYRRRLGQSAGRDDYQPRFPDQAAVLDEIFLATKTATAGDSKGQDTAPLVQAGADRAGGPLPDPIGRFEILARIGEGSFGIVYRARDTALQRDVAIKVARQGRATGLADLQLLEAQVAAGLDHPGIVPVYEVGRLADGRLFIVAKLIEGTDLRTRLKEATYSPTDAVRLIATVAEALHAAHQNGIIHRDLKPANILIDKAHRPYVVDFGLALRQEQTGVGAEFVGTPAYMSPEQAREEGHLVDARSDIFSLAVILYELLTGSRPFQAAARSELLQKIRAAAPRPPSAWNSAVPAELDRIVLKALARQAGDRYPSAEALAGDLQTWLQPSAQPAPAKEENLLVRSKGLLAFDEDDAAFFLRLVAGPRHRSGLPEAIAFWKSAIESRDSSRAFRVGVIYGPSGSGKSSLIQAGLLPLLNKSVTVCKVAAMPAGTGDAWLLALRRLFPALNRADDLPQAMRDLRGGKAMSREGKVFIVLDQFEQWLASAVDLDASDVAMALRQCDAVHAQALLIVRDDFWYPLSRLARFLDIPLDITNCRMVEICDEEHARRILWEFARAQGHVAPVGNDPVGETGLFIEAVVHDLSESGPIIPVQLALVAEMFRHRAWRRTELQRLGGVRGVLSQFLDDRIAGPSAHPTLRQVPDAVLRILRTLLPTSATAIRGKPHSLTELHGHAATASRAQCQEILDVLEREVRVVAKVDPSEGDGSEPAYQLAHDYLVPVVHEWAQRQRRSTYRGRAESLLSDRTDAWRLQRSRKLLPSLTEWFFIHCLTRRRDWTAPSRAMMRGADRWHLTRIAAGLLLGILIFLALFHSIRARDADDLVDRLLAADTPEVPAIAHELEQTQRYGMARLEAAWRRLQVPSKQPSDPRAVRQQFNVQLALARFDPSRAANLIETLAINSDQLEPSPVVPRDLRAVCELLRPHRRTLLPPLWPRMLAARDEPVEISLRRTSVLAQLDPHNPHWPQVAETIAAQLVKASPTQVTTWAELLWPVRDALLSPLESQFGNPASRSHQRNLAEVYAILAGDELPRVLAILGKAELVQLPILLPVIARHRDTAELDRAFSRARTIPHHLADQSFSLVAPAVADQLTRWQGALSDTAAFAQSVPIDSVDTLLDAMRKAGYRPTSFRPYRQRATVNTAVGWRRDGGDFLVRYGLTAEELQQANALADHRNLALADFAVYRSGPDARSDRFAATWGAAQLVGRGKHLAIDLEADDYERAVSEFTTAGLVRERFLVRQAENGSPLFSMLWSKENAPDVLQAQPVVETAAEFRDWYIGWRPSDCQLAPIDLHRTDLYQPHSYYTRHREDPGDQPDDLFDLATATLLLGHVKESLSLAEKLADDDPTRPDFTSLLLRGLVANGQTERALRELDRFTDSGLPTSQFALVKLRAALALNDLTAAEGILAELVPTPSGTQAADRWNSARALVLLIKALGPDPSKRADNLRTQAIGILSEVPHAYLVQTVRDSEWDGLRASPDYRQFLEDHGLGLRYACIWRGAGGLRSRFVIQCDLDQQREFGLAALKAGYWPHTVALGCLPESHRLVGASVWYRPWPTTTQRVQRATVLANTAIALAYLGDDQHLVEVLSDQYGRQARSEAIERLAGSGVDPDRLAELFFTAESRALRRHLILALGNIPQAMIRAPHQRRLVAALQELASASAQADLRSASRWCLTEWGESIPPEASSPEAGSPRSVSLNALGQEMISVQTPGSILMGAPTWDDDFRANEVQHVRSLPHRFALSATEVTVEQFRRFRSDPKIGRLYARIGTFTYREELTPDPDCAQISVRFMDAVRFCQWLSQQEGIPEDQWCYPGSLDSATESVRAPDDYLQRTGYRLPLEAEWEYACRAGARTSRHYGESAHLLPAFAWYDRNAGYCSHPVGRRKPNDWGFFDMLGNASEWTQDVNRLWYEPEDVTQTVDLTGDPERVVRGGSFSAPATSQRSAQRAALDPADKLQYVGFRVARTL